MTQKEIRNKRDSYYKMLQDAREGLQKLRAECYHPNTEKCTYEWASATFNAIVCSDCGEVVKNLDLEAVEFKVETDGT